VFHPGDDRSSRNYILYIETKIGIDRPGPETKALAKRPCSSDRIYFLAHLTVFLGRERSGLLVRGIKLVARARTVGVDRHGDAHSSLSPFSATWERAVAPGKLREKRRLSILGERNPFRGKSLGNGEGGMK
jgi:hypothetical protein